MPFWAPGPLWPYNKFEITRELWKALEVYRGVLKEAIQIEETWDSPLLRHEIQSQNSCTKEG